MSWHWTADLVPGAAPDPVEVGLDTHFPSQGEAETWLGESYPDLADAGVSAVSLFEEERLVYGPMSLHPDAG